MTIEIVATACWPSMAVQVSVNVYVVRAWSEFADIAKLKDCVVTVLATIEVVTAVVALLDREMDESSILQTADADRETLMDPLRISFEDGLTLSVSVEVIETTGELAANDVIVTDFSAERVES